MRRRTLLTLLGSAAVSLAAAPALAQPAATPSPLPASPLFSTALAPLGPGPHVVVFSRAALAPGQTLALGATVGPALAFIANGSATLTAQTAGVRAVSASASAALAPGAVTSATAETLLLLDVGATVNLAGSGTAPVQLLNAVVSPAPQPAATPSGANPAFTEPVALPSGALQVDVVHLTLPAGATAAVQSSDGPVLVAVEHGAVTVTLNPGRLRLLRADGSVEFIAGAKIDPAAVPTLNANDPEDKEIIEAQHGDTTRKMVGAQISLSAGDAGLIEPDGSLSVANGGAVPAEIVTLGLAPAPAATPGA
jgi:hypothetical protein